jgi:hypothetical protein
MKKNLLLIAFVLLSGYAMAQRKSDFPFMGGKEHMMLFFKDSLIVSPEIIKKKATGVVTFKFTSDADGNLSKMVVFYADDPILVQPVIDAIKKSAKQWHIPQGRKTNDYVISFSFGFTLPPAYGVDVERSVLEYITTRRPIVSDNQALLDNGIVLPTVMVSYDILDQ